MARYTRNILLLEGDPALLEEAASRLRDPAGKEALSFAVIIPAEDTDSREELWGTAGDAEETDMILFRGGTALEYTFDTEKTCPVPVMRRLAVMYPDFRMSVRYAYEDLGNGCGIYESEEGSSELVFREPEDPFVFACDVWGRDPDEELSELGINYAEE